MNKQGKVLSVEGVRGVACFMVLLSHLSLAFYPYIHAFKGKANIETSIIQSIIHDSPFAFLFSGTSAVFIFFVLSGYILTKVALKENGTSSKIYSMAIKRYPRLMIPALASCLLAYTMFYLFDASTLLATDWINSYASSNDTSFWGAIYSGVFDVFFLSGTSAYNPVLWTMKIELIGSFLIYLLCLNRMVYRLPLLLVIFVVITVLLVVFRTIDVDLGLGLVAFYGGYFIGIYGKEVPYKVAITVAIVGLYLAGAHNTSLSYAYIYTFLGEHTYKICNFISGFLIVYSVLFNQKIRSVLAHKIPVFMGKLSFSVYLIHLPILSTVGLFTLDWLYSVTGEYNFSAIVTSIFTIVLTYLLAIVFYKKVDENGMKISHVIAKRILDNGRFSRTKASH